MLQTSCNSSIVRFSDPNYKYTKDNHHSNYHLLFGQKMKNICILNDAYMNIVCEIKIKIVSAKYVFYVGQWS